ncbi:MAG: AtpZ/AtpI family protein [Propionibacteriaceae bacterium]|jgi:F0F1-type ATP synthase assembly protein I|nr:AtpZ/AtpI family protein [Propionibacteriaceae bacterium]
MGERWRVKRGTEGRDTDKVHNADKVPLSTDQSDGFDKGMRVVSVLISGIVFYGAIGWGLDHWLNSVLWTPVGLILGAALGVYWVIRKYGQAQ